MKTLASIVAGLLIAWSAFWVGHLKGFSLARSANESGARLVLARIDTASSNQTAECNERCETVASALRDDMMLIVREAESARSVPLLEIAAAPIAQPLRARKIQRMIDGFADPVKRE